MKIVLTVVAVLALLAAALVVAAWAGWVGVAATDPDPPLVAWYLTTAREGAIAAAVGDVEVPPLDDPRLLRTGVVRYHALCEGCHGAPGVDPGPIARGLNPLPPELHGARPAGERPARRAARTYWILANGVRMTGMPAFGPLLGDDELWALTAFVERLPELTPEQYRAMVASAGRAAGEAPGPAPEEPADAPSPPG